MFTLFEHTSINLLYLLAVCFKNVSLFKPIASKPGNSEIYVICTNYCSIRNVNPFVKKLTEFYGTDNFLTKSLFPLDFVPKLFLDDLFKASNLFYSHQYKTIEKNISIFENKSSCSKTFKNIYKVQKVAAKIFMMQTRLQPIDKEHIICRNVIKIDKNKNAHYHSPNFESFAERKNSSDVLNIEKLLKYRLNLSELSENFHVFPSILKCEKLSKVPLEFSYGKPIKILYSSKFIFVQIFKISMELDMFKVENLKDISLNKSDNGYTISFDEFDNTELKQNLTLKYIYEALNLMNNDDILIFENFNLLSQFNASIIYILGMIAFEEVIFDQNSTIKFTYFKNKVEIIDYFNILLSNITDIEQTSNKSILGILPLKCLLSEPFYGIVCNYNNYNFVNKINHKIEKLLLSANA